MNRPNISDHSTPSSLLPSASPRGGGIAYRDLIEAKKAGKALTRAQIYSLAQAVHEGRWPDEQIAALLMAFRIKGMSSQETSWLTLAMAHYSAKVPVPDSRKFIADKHSSGGVGDGVSLVLAPLASALGLTVPMMSGRSLGLTGGTLDKLEAIPGLRTQIKPAALASQLKNLGLAMFGQSREIAPVDRKLYSLRDAIGAVDSTGLIVSSILSKKLTEGLRALVLDVKSGCGAIFSTAAQARRLARELARVARLSGLACRAVLTRMDEPLGRAVGNAVETRQAWEIMKPGSVLQKAGWAPVADYMEVLFELLFQMLDLTGLVQNRSESMEKAVKALQDGRALEKFQGMILAQGASPQAARDLPSCLPRPGMVIKAASLKTGFVEAINARSIALASLTLRVLRRGQEDAVDLSAGIELLKKRSEPVSKGEIIARVFCTSSSKEDCKMASQVVTDAYSISQNRPKPQSQILEVL